MDIRNVFNSTSTQIPVATQLQELRKEESQPTEDTLVDECQSVYVHVDSRTPSRQMKECNKVDVNFLTPT